MFASLSTRVAAIGLIVVVALMSFAWVLTDAALQTKNSFLWVKHSASVIETTEQAVADLREAESGQRGFVLTHNAIWARSFAERIDSSRANIERVVHLTRDNYSQHRRAEAIAALIAERSAVLRQPLDLGKAGDFDGATAVIASGRGRELMDAITARTQDFLDEERALQVTRGQAAESRLARSRWLTIAGALFVALLVVVGLALLVRSIRRPLDTMMEAMTALGHGGHARIDAAMGSHEFAQLADGYNAMADQLEFAVLEQAVGEQRLQAANAEMQRNGDALRARGDIIELLAGMSHRMQAARTDDELAQIVRVFVPRVLPDNDGALFAYNNSRNLLVPIAQWGEVAVDGDGFAPDQCWALRRGCSHGVETPGQDIVCGHVGPDEPYHCEPLLAGGEVIGVLYLRGQVEAEGLFRLAMLTENIASALLNHGLQRSLREQTIRDPLTGLFNRRYMQETLALEIARASRSGEPLSLVMCDVDHFKRFNDEFGHDAGDAVLQAVANEMRDRFREGDVVCRYGGEEFTIIAPGTSAATLISRVELVRKAISDLSVRQNGRLLGSTSMSFGIADWSQNMDREGAALIQAADAALYQAKRDGRNRAAISLLAA